MKSLSLLACTVSHRTPVVTDKDIEGGLSKEQLSYAPPERTQRGRSLHKARSLSDIPEVGRSQSESPERRRSVDDVLFQNSRSLRIGPDGRDLHPRKLHQVAQNDQCANV